MNTMRKSTGAHWTCKYEHLINTAFGFGFEQRIRDQCTDIAGANYSEVLESRHGVRDCFVEVLRTVGDEVESCSELPSSTCLYIF